MLTMAKSPEMVKRGSATIISVHIIRACVNSSTHLFQRAAACQPALEITRKIVVKLIE